MPGTFHLRLPSPPIRIRVADGNESWSPPRPRPNPPPKAPERPGADDVRAILAALDRVAESVDRLAAQRASTLAEWRAVAVELAFAVAARVTHQAFEEDRFPVERMVAETVSHLGAAENVKVRLNPADLEALTRSGGELPAGLDVEADANLGRGDCLAEAGDRMVASQLRGQFARLREELLGKLGHARP